ncbi:MAG TPA: hypothetical protein VN896_07885, partial [Methylomirabilota bacterium]|nr:hypothetical protein [Methylomirabilota bacterium]
MIIQPLSVGGVGPIVPGNPFEVFQTNSLGTAVLFALITDDNVASAAAIAGTKIAPDFGAQNVVTTGTFSAGASTVTALTVSGLGLGVVHSSAGGVFSSSLIVNADVAAGAAIDGTKIAPDFGAQNIVTTGTLDAGAGTLTGLTVSGLGLGVVHSSAGGVFSSSLIVNADVAAGAAIDGAKVVPAFGIQNISTTGTLSAGAGTLTGLTVSGLGLGVVHSSAGGVFSSSLIVNADVAAAAAIAGTKISPDFGAQDVITTGNYIGNSGTSVLRLGLASGSGAGVASAASQGTIRGARGAAGSALSIWVRNNADTTDLKVFEYDSTAPRYDFGSSSVADVRLFAQTNLDLNSGGVRQMRVNNGTINVTAPNFVFGSTVATPQLGQSATSTNGSTGQALTIFAQGVTATGGANIGAALEVKAGDTPSSGTNSTGGKHTSRGGDASLASATNVGGDYFVRPGRGTGTGAADGNMAIMAEPASYQAMQRGSFWGNALTVPTDNPPSGGGYEYAFVGAKLWRAPNGGLTTMGGGGTNVASVRIPHHTAPKVATATTNGLATSTVVSYDLSSSSEALNAI